MFSTLSKQQEKLLQTSPLFDSLTPEQIRPVLYCLQAEVRRAAPRQIIIQPQECSSGLFIVLSGAIELAGDAENAEIETASGKVDIAGALGALDFESVSGDLILATECALRLDAETESGSIYLTLPAQDGFTLDYETKSGAFRSTLTEREGALITCGDHEAYYTVPALDGGAVSELEISTVSGTLTIDTSSGSN